MLQCMDLPDLVKTAKARDTQLVVDNLGNWMHTACGTNDAAAKCARQDVQDFSALLNKACTQYEDKDKPLIQALSYVFSDYDALYAQIMAMVCGIVE